MSRISPLIGLCCVLWILPSACLGQDADKMLARWPGEQGKTLEVQVGIYLIEFARINSRDETFDVVGYLDLSWVEPRLALKSDEKPQGLRRISSDEISAPELEFINAVEQVRGPKVGDVYVDDSGRVFERIRFSNKFSSGLDLQLFPFDRQALAIRLSPYDRFARDLKLVVAPKRVGRSEESFLSDWYVEGIDATVGSVRRLDNDDPVVIMEIRIKRRSTYYCFRVFLPMLLIVFASWSALWFEIPNLQPQISTGISFLLSILTFNYSIDFQLPKVHYLTFLDRFTLTSFLMVLSIIPVITLLHLLHRKFDLELAQKVQRVARLLFPLVYLTTIAAEIYLFLT